MLGSVADRVIPIALHFRDQKNGSMFVNSVHVKCFSQGYTFFDFAQVEIVILKAVEKETPYLVMVIRVGHLFVGFSYQRVKIGSARVLYFV